tara:strand:- start:129 stop:2300 length:2172 start_codon:yes stop_codon:yes gene_type:complete
MKFKITVCTLALCSAFSAGAEDTEEAPRDPQIQTITILGAPEELPRMTGSAHVVDEEEMERYSYDDINRVLNVVPGIYVREEDGFGLRPNIGLRGGSSDRSQKVTLLEDGVLFGPAPYSAPAAYFFPLTARMTGVEVYKGPAAISQGPQTVGGAINLLSAPIPAQAGGFVEAAGGSDAFRRLHARYGGPVKEFGLLGEYVHVAHDGFKDLDSGGDTGFVKNEALLKARYALGPGVLEMRLGYADEISNESYLGITEADFRSNPNRRYAASQLDHFDWDWNGVRLDWQQDIFGGELLVSGYSHQFHRAWRKFNNLGGGSDVRDVLANPDTPSNSLLYDVLTGASDSDPGFEGDDILVGTNDRDFRSSGVQAKQVWTLEQWGGEHRLEAGVRLHSDRILREHDQFAYEMEAGRLVRNALPGGIITHNTGRTLAAALWIRDEARYGRWTFAPGIRVEQISSDFIDHLAGIERSNDYAIALPGLGINYALTPATTLLVGVHKGFSPATVGPSEDLEPEEAINYEAGTRVQTRAGDIELIGFFSDYSNLTSTCTFSSGCQVLDTQTNAGKVEIAGFESSYQHAWTLSQSVRVPLHLGYTYTHAEFQEDFNSSDPQFGNVQAGFELPYIPEHRANARVGLEFAQWSTSLSATYQSRMRDVAGDGPIEAATGSDAFTVVDLAAAWQPVAKVELSARIDNLLDREYITSRRPFGARPGKPQSAQLAVKYLF